MNSPGTWRVKGTVLLVSATATIYAIVDYQKTLAPVPPRRAALTSPPLAPAPNPTHLRPRYGRDSIDVDPFAPRGWDEKMASDPTPPSAVVPNPQPATEAVQSPVAPAHPYKFMGRLSEAGQAFVYISSGEVSWTVKGGELLDADFSVVSVGEEQIVFEHIPTGTRQVLDIPKTEN